MKNRVLSIKYKVWKMANLSAGPLRQSISEASKAGRIWSLVHLRLVKKVIRPFSLLFNRLILKLPHKYRVRIYNLQRRIINHKKAAAFLVLLMIIPVVLFQFRQIDHGNLPWNEKVAEGAYILRNREPVHQALANGPKKGPNLKESPLRQGSEGQANLKSDEKYRWSASLPSGTKFEFGLVPGKDQYTSIPAPEGKVLPEVKITNKEGYFVRYAPKGMVNGQLSMVNDEKINNQQLTINNYVAPKVNGNVIEWEIADGITARYEMMTDRVKADYLIDNREALCSPSPQSSPSRGEEARRGCSLEFDVNTGNSNPLATQGPTLQGELMPGGDIEWYSDSSGTVETKFVIPKPVVSDSNKDGNTAPGSHLGASIGSNIDAKYELSKVKEGEYSLSILLDPNQVASAAWPITVDPVVIDSSSTTTGTAYGNERKILKDAWGNLIAFMDGGTGDDNVYYKNYDSSSWTDGAVDLDAGSGSSNGIAADIDSYGDIHTAFINSTDSDLEYVKLIVLRNGNNQITQISRSNNEDIDTSDVTSRPSLVVANKGGGEGIEKAVITYNMNTTNRGEIRVINKDINEVDYAKTILNTSNLKGYWRLGETSGTNAEDISTNANDGSYTNTPTLGVTGAIPGDSDTGVTFASATSEYMSAPDSPSWDIGTGDYSVELWMKINGLPVGDVYMQEVFDGSTNGIEMGLFGNGRLTSRVNGTVDVLSANPANVTDNNWHHVVIVMDRDGVGTWYVDGAVSGTPTDISGQSSANINGTSVFYVGRRTGGNYFNGSLDDVAFYNKALTTAEVLNHYNVGAKSLYKNTIINTSGLSGYWRLGESSGTNANDESATANDGTYAGTPTLGVSGALSDGNTAATFASASTEYVSAPDNDAYDFGSGVDFSLEFWMKRSSWPGSSQFILGHNGDNDVADWEAVATSVASRLQSRLWGIAVSSGTATKNDNKWHHIVLTMDRDGVGQWYTDGKPDGLPTDISSESTRNLNSTSVLYIARRNTAGYFDGSLDEVAVYKGVALTPEQIKSHFRAGSIWRNASDEITGNGTSSDTATSGEAGMPSSTTVKGTADKLFAYTANTTTHHGVLTQIPGKPKRSPASVMKDINGTFSVLSSTNDGSTSTTHDINNLTTTDYIYIGDSKPFSKVSFDFLNPSSASATLSTTTVEYCSIASSGTCGTWTDLPNFTDNTSTGSITFSENGSVLFDEPSNWTTATINSVSGKYWIRLRPSAALDTQVYIKEIYINDRNSKALLVAGGIDFTDDLGASYIPWDEVSNAGWENNPAAAGNGWRENTIALDTLGGGWGNLTNFPLSSAVDYVNNRVYIAYVEDNATDVLRVETVANNKDPTVAANWTDTGFPTVTEAGDLALSLTSDESDIYLFYVLDPGTNSLVFRRCNGIGAPSNGVCDNANDWGSEKTLYVDTTVSHPSAIATKLTSDVVAIDALFTDTTDTDVLYERHYADLTDKTVVVAASGDDADENDCADTAQNDDGISSALAALGRYSGEAGCSPAGADYNAGFRFPNISVAQGAKISSAYIDLRVRDRNGSTPIPFTVYGEDRDDASAFSSYTNNCPAADLSTSCIFNRTRTTTGISYSINFSGTTSQGTTYRLDVTDIVQEIVCRGAANSQPCVGDFNGSGAWASGNALALLLISNIDSGSSNYVQFDTFDLAGTTMLDPTLQINCEGSCTTVNPPNTAWCNIGTGASAATDCNANWIARKKVTFDNRASAENLTNFPVLVRLDSTSIDYSKVQNAGQDLRFVDTDNLTLLDYEIEKWDEGGESLVWVEVPSIALGVATDYVWMYYNNSAGSAGQNANNTWNTNYEGVWHLKEDPSTTCAGSNEICDSTSNNADGNMEGSMTSSDLVTGQIGNAIDFDGVNDAFTGNHAAFPSGAGTRTLEAWVRTTSTAIMNPFGYGQQVDPEDFAIRVVNGQLFMQIRLNVYSFGSTGVLSDGLWHHVVIAWDGTVGEGYIDGIEVGSDQNPTPDPITDVGTGDFEIGVWSGFWAGMIDEIRITDNDRSVDWIEAEYLSTKSDSTFVSVGAEQAITLPKDTSSSNYASEILGTTGLVAYWRLGEPSGTAADNAQGNATFDGVYQNTPTLGASGALINDTNTAVTFTGAGVNQEYVTMSDFDLPTTNALTVEAWFKGAAADWGDTGVWGQWYPAAGGRAAMLYTTGDGNISFWLSTSDVAQQELAITGRNDLLTGWHHYVTVYDGSNMKMYIDGVLAGTSASITGTVSTSVEQFYIAQYGHPSGTYMTTGSIDDVSVYNIAFTADQVSKHYGLGRGAGKSVVKNYSKGFTYTTGSASFADLEHPLSAAEYVSVEGDDNNYAVVSANLDVTASTSAVPMFMFKQNNPGNTNNYQIDATAVVKSSVPSSTKTIHMQIYRGGSTNNWVDVDTDSSTAADTDITLDMTAITSSMSEYYFNETPGIGTRYGACTNNTANCWAYFRIYQDSPGTSVNENLSVDYFNAEFDPYSQPALRGGTRLKGGTRLR